MRLYIDTGSAGKIIIEIDEMRVERDARVEKAQMLLGVIEEELEKMGGKIQDLKEIEINLGPGSFTGLRVGVSVANTLSWSLQIPINGKFGLVEPVY